jgi:hypothetical protein
MMNFTALQNDALQKYAVHCTVCTALHLVGVEGREVGPEAVELLAGEKLELIIERIHRVLGRGQCEGGMGAAKGGGREGGGEGRGRRKRKKRRD